MYCFKLVASLIIILIEIELANNDLFILFAMHSFNTLPGDALGARERIPRESAHDASLRGF